MSLTAVVIWCTISAILLTVLAMGLFGSQKSFQVDGRTIIVTGGSQGLGLAVSKLLARKGANVVIVAQDVIKLEKALNDIQACSKSSTKQRFLHLSYDLRSPKSASEILAKVTKWNSGNPPDVVFNCAGHCIPGFFASSSLDTLQAQMDTLYWSCAYIAHATLNSWIEPVDKQSQQKYQNPRHLIFTSSALAFLPLAGYAPYNPAKAAMRSLADTLNQEVQAYNGARLHPTEPGPAAEIKVHAIYPMGIKSPGFENEQKMKPALTQKLEEEDKPQDPDELAQRIISELEAGQYMITASLIGHIMKGWGFGGSQRVGVMDYLWTWLGTLVVFFIVPDFISKCRKWGKEKGISGVR